MTSSQSRLSNVRKRTRSLRTKRSKQGASEVIATVMMLGLTVAVGFALFSFAQDQAGVQLRAFNDDTVNRINRLNEKFVIVHIAFDHPVSNNVTVWFYNNGKLTTEIKTIFFGNDTSSLTEESFAPIPLTIAPEETKKLTFIVSSLDPQETYYVRALGKYGNTFTTFEAFDQD